MKVFPVALALDTGQVTPGTMIDTKGPMRWGASPSATSTTTGRG